MCIVHREKDYRFDSDHGYLHLTHAVATRAFPAFEDSKARLAQANPWVVNTYPSYLSSLLPLSGIDSDSLKTT